MVTKVKSSKKGNITLFVLLGLVVIILLSVTSYYLFEYYSTQNLVIRTVQDDIEGFENSVESCYQSLVPESLLYVNIQSGRAYPDYINDGLVYGDIEISKYLMCYYNDSEKQFADFVPTQEDVEFELTRSIQDNLDPCIIGSINNYKNILNISYTYVKVNTIIEDKKVSFNINPNLIINYELNENAYSYKLPQYNMHERVDNKNYLNIAGAIVKDIENNSGALDLEKMTEHNISINITAFPNQIYWFDLYDNISDVQLGKDTYESHYYFAVDLNCRR